MQIRAVKKTVVLICLSVYLLTALGVSGPMVWCIGSNGHLAYEPIHPSTPCLGSNANIGSAKNRMPTTVASDSNRTCVDQPLLLVQWHWSFDLSRLGTQAFKLLPASFVSISSSTQGIDPIRSLGSVESALPAISLDALCSVIILI